MYFTLYYAVLYYLDYAWKVNLTRVQCCPDITQLSLSSLFPRILPVLRLPYLFLPWTLPLFLSLCSKTKAVHLSVKWNQVIWWQVAEVHFGWWRKGKVRGGRWLGHFCPLLSLRAAGGLQCAGNFPSLCLPFCLLRYFCLWTVSPASCKSVCYCSWWS